MRHNDTIVVVVLDVVEETHAVGGRKVFLRSVQNPHVGIIPIILAVSACALNCLYSPCTGIKNFGFASDIINFCSS